MAGLSAVFNSPFYWGDISLEETINILEQERPKSYLFRKLKNGSVTLACLIDSKVVLREIEVKDCKCTDGFQPIQKFKTLAEFVGHCNISFGSSLGKLFLHPVKRKNVFSLKELSKSFISNYVDKFDELMVPETLKKELTEDFSKNHNHFEVILNEKEAIWKRSGGNYEHLGFNISKGNGKVVTYLISFSNFQLSTKFC